MNLFIEALPAINSLSGFIMYSFVTYLFILIVGWLVNPTMEKWEKEDTKKAANRDRGSKAREENRREIAEQAKKSELFKRKLK